MAEWRAVPGYAAYEVSNEGGVRSYHRNRWGRLKKPRELSCTPDRAGYPVANLYGDDGRRTVHVHRLVLEVFVGPCPEGGQVRHLDGNRTNNALANLRYGTVFENAQDRRRHGTATNQHAAKTHCPKGHVYAGENLYVDKRGYRYCRSCWTERATA